MAVKDRQFRLTDLPLDTRPPQSAHESYRASFHLAPIGLVHVASDGTYLAANQCFCEMVGYTHEELLTLRFSDLTHPEDVADDTESVKRMMAREIPTNTRDKRYVHKDGSIVWAHVTSTLVWDERSGTPSHFITAIEDAGPRIEAERELRQSREDLQFAITAGGLGTFYCDWPLDKIIWNDTCKEHFYLPVEAEIDFDVFYSRLHPDDRDPTRLAIEKAANEQVEYNVEYRTVGPDGQTRWINAVGRFFYHPDGTPMRFDGITIDITARKEAQLERMARARREELLNRIAQTIRTSFDPDEIEIVAVSALSEFLQADRCYLSIIDMASDMSTVGNDYHREDLPSIAGRYKLSDANLNPDDYFSPGKTRVIEDIGDPSVPKILAARLRNVGISSFVGVPLYEEGRLSAVFGVAMAAGPRQWTDDEISVIEAVASYTRSVLEATRRVSERQARLEREALINRIGVALRSETEPVVIQSTAVRLLGEALSADRCYFAVYDLTHAEVVVEAEWRRADLPAIKGVHRFPNTREMFAELYRGSNASVVVDAFDSVLSAQTIANMKSLHLRARISVAVAEATGLAATLTAAMAEGPREWTPHEVQLVEAVAVQMRTAVEMAQVQQREHRIATDLQAAMQPAVPADVPNLDITAVTKPALDEAAIGGDFYDVFPLGGSLYACVIGDVSGKGLAAAAQLATVRNMLRGFLYQSRSPAESVSILNRTLTNNDLLTGFVTVLAAVYDVSSGKLAYTSCGHEPALIRRTSGSVDTLYAGSPPLGVTEEATYAEYKDDIGEGDTLFLYTDGLSEAGPTRRDLLGTERLAGFLAGAPADMSAHETAHWLVEKASAFANATFHDDVCVIVARRKSF